MPVYLHKLSRVCTLAKPYYLGSGSSRKHEIPVSAIPCLAYRRELAKEKECIKNANTAKKDELLGDTLERRKDEHHKEQTGDIGKAREESEEKEEMQIDLTADRIKKDDSTKASEKSEEKEEMQIDSAADSSSCPMNHSDQPTAHLKQAVNQADAAMNDTQETESQSNDLVSATVESLTKDSQQQDVSDKAMNSSAAPTDNGQQASSNKKPSFIAKVETVKDNKKERSLNYTKVREYCENLFEFQEITIRKFKTWADRKNHMQQRKLAQRPSLPEGTKLITCPLPVNKEQGPETQGRNMRKEFVMNPAGKSSVCILHEFVQHAERVQPKYVFQELENATTPYSATVIINDMQYGTGYGSSKKQAKSEAAKVTLEILIPDMKEKEMSQSGGGSKKPDVETNDLSFFDDIKVNDPRVSELCAKAGQHSPYQILVECLRRNNGMGDTDIETNVRLVKHQKNEFTMKVGKHVKTVICRNKREGKQHAAQAILQELHPQIQNWGSLLRLYGRGSCKTPKEKKEEEQKITELQNTACANKPNYAILNKLREEMLKLKEENDVSYFLSGPFNLVR